MTVVAHMLYDITADFFWDIRYAAFFAALVGLLCGQARRLPWEYSTDEPSMQVAFAQGIS